MTGREEAAAAPLVEACRALLQEGRDRAPAAIAEEIDAVLSLWPKPGRTRLPAWPRLLPACAFLPEALRLGAAGPAGPVCDAIGSNADPFAWHFGYPADPRWPDLGARLAFTQILGPKGLFHAEHLRVGLTLQAPHTHYPLHAHPAIELYVVLAGVALWQAGEAAPVARPIGAIVLHESGVPHAMTTDDEPLLALFTWRGDLQSPSVFVD